MILSYKRLRCEPLFPDPMRVQLALLSMYPILCPYPKLSALISQECYASSLTFYLHLHTLVIVPLHVYVDSVISYVQMLHSQTYLPLFQLFFFLIILFIYIPATESPSLFPQFFILFHFPLAAKKVPPTTTRHPPSLGPSLSWHIFSH